MRLLHYVPRAFYSSLFITHIIHNCNYLFNHYSPQFKRKYQSTQDVCSVFSTASSAAGCLHRALAQGLWWASDPWGDGFWSSWSGGCSCPNGPESWFDATQPTWVSTPCWDRCVPTRALDHFPPTSEWSEAFSGEPAFEDRGSFSSWFSGKLYRGYRLATNRQVTK